MKNNNRLLKVLGLTVMSCGFIMGREFRSPLSLYRESMHYSFDREDNGDNCFGLICDTWAAGYSRSAIDAYGRKWCKDNSSCSDCSSDCVSDSASCSSICSGTTSCPIPTPSTLVCGASNSNKIELTQLLFGKADFQLVESFAGTVISPGSATNPFVIVSTLSPRYEYNERGAFFGFHVAKRFGCDDNWRGGMRIRLPYRDIDMEEVCSLESSITGETLSDLYRIRQEVNDFSGVPVTNSQVFAGRLDFLTALNRVAFNASGGTEPLVVYNDPNNGGEMTIGGQKVSGGLSSAQAPNNIAPFVAALKRDDGSLPINLRWADTPQNSATVIQSDGSGLGADQRGRFVNDISYAALGGNPAAQGQLWIVPNVDPTTGLLIPAANTVRAEIDNSVANIDSSITPFLQANQIDFCHGGHNKGVGDLDLEWYVGYQHCKNFWGELQLGLRVPTAKRLTNPLFLVRQPLGNNGHVEIRPGLTFGWDGRRSSRLKVDLTYSFVLKRVEHLPAAFVGATVMNIGPDALGNVSWSYFLGSIDFTHLHPRNENVGVTIGYEAYAKRKDKIKFCQRQVADFNGNLQTLDAGLLRCNSDRVSHKIKGEIFCASQCCDVFAGFTQVIAGKNITRDTDMYIGIHVNF